MQYIGIPTCPYCKKTVNIIRVWKIKKSGEFMCPRCKGISNVYLSPLIYVLAVISVASGFLIYFFDRFIWATTSIMSPVKVLLPFVAFFVLSLFMVYFKKPIIRKVRKTKDGRYFDQNGNELKMRMGKLVAISSVEKEAKKVSTQENQNIYNFDDIGSIDFKNNENEFLNFDNINLNDEKENDFSDVESIDINNNDSGLISVDLKNLDEEEDLFNSEK